ncbi:MAG: AsmA-like C-terminal region-containing protein [Cytophagaceae bacterium]
MKKGILIFLGIIVFLIAALALIPFLFKDQIKAKIDAELAKSINAEIIYDTDKLSLSVFRNFPNITIGINDFTMLGKQEEFKGDTLFAAKEMLFAADIMSVIKGDKIKLKKIYLNQPVIATYIAKNGKMSWDIAIASPEDTLQKEPSEPSEFNIAIEGWEIENGLIIYDDQTLPMYAELRKVNHKGKGDLTKDIFDMQTSTLISQTTIVFDGVKYLDKHEFEANVNMNMDLANSVYKFLENKFRINNFTMGIDGSLAMKDDNIIYDITYDAKETEFKNLISLIPAIFTNDYDKLKTEGSIAFNGHIKGTQSATTLPGFALNLKINKGMLQYPELPSAISNVNADILVDNKDGIIDNTVLNVKNFHMEMGKNPVDAKVLVEGLRPYKIDADIAAKVNLEDVTKFYPIDGTTLKGLFALQVKAKGLYSDSLHLMPVVDAKVGITNGYVKTKDFPSALENINLSANAQSSGDMKTSKATLENFSMLLDGEPFQAKAFVENFDNIAYDVSLKGIIDLTKMTKIYPLEDMTVSGRIGADISTKGVMSDIDAGRYDKTSTSGTMDVKNLKYISKDFPQGMTLTDASFALTPDKMTINNMTGYLGKSDIDITGYVSNYMGYAFGHGDTVIRGKMTFKSKKFDVNEWMTEEEETVQAANTAPDTAVFEVPKDVDFLLASDIKEVLYDNMNLTNVKGNVIMKDGIAKLDNLIFDLVGGNFVTNGTYNTQNISQPKFDFDLKISQMQIKEAFKTFNTVQTFAPVAENMEGTVNAKLTLKSDLDKTMSPVYSTMFGAGVLQIPQAQIAGNNVLQGISKLTGTKGLDPMGINNVNVKFKIEDGRLKVEPFDLNAAGIKMNIGGSTILDGGLDYLVKMDVPAGAVGEAVNSAIGQFTGNKNTSQNIKFDLKVGGTAKDPKITLASSSVKEQATEQVKSAVENKIKEELNNNAEIQKAKEEAERLQREAEERFKAEQEKLKKEAEEKAKKEAEERLKKEAEKNLKDKIKVPGLK